MPDLDVMLRRLGDEAAPEPLAAVEARVLQRVIGHSFEQEPLRFRVGAVTLALLMGVAGGILPEWDGSGNDLVAPFGEPAGLAPSTLLIGRS